MTDLRKVDTIRENDIISIDILQDSDLFFNLIVTPVDRRKTQIARDLNRLPRICEFNPQLEKRKTGTNTK